MGLDTLFGWILNKIEKASFLTWVYPWQKAVRVCGKRYKAVGPGFHLKLPYAMEYHDEDVTWRKVSCGEQKVHSASGTVWVISLNMLLRVTNIVKALVETHDYEESVLTDAQDTIAEWVNATSDEQITIEALMVDCLGEIKKRARRWGCEVRELGASNFAPFDRVFCVVGREAETLFEE